MCVWGGKGGRAGNPKRGLFQGGCISLCCGHWSCLFVLLKNAASTDSCINILFALTTVICAVSGRVDMSGRFKTQQQMHGIVGCFVSIIIAATEPLEAHLRDADAPGQPLAQRVLATLLLEVTFEPGLQAYVVVVVQYTLPPERAILMRHGAMGSLSQLSVRAHTGLGA